MDALADIPCWVGTAVFGLITGVLGFISKQLYEVLKGRRTARANVRRNLEDLDVLLGNSGSLFRNQNDQAQRLLDMLRRSHPGRVPAGVGYDAVFCALFGEFSPEERRLHTIIRSVTRHSLRGVNNLLAQWLKENRHLLAKNQRTTDLTNLAEQLRLLQLHLDQWDAKYQEVFLKQECSALVYLADELNEGQGFPPKLEPALRQVLRKGE